MKRYLSFVDRLKCNTHFRDACRSNFSPLEEVVGRELAPALLSRKSVCFLPAHVPNLKTGQRRSNHVCKYEVEELQDIFAQRSFGELHVYQSGLSNR